MPPCRDSVYFCNVPSASWVRPLVNGNRIGTDGDCSRTSCPGVGRDGEGDRPVTRSGPGDKGDPGSIGGRTPCAGTGSLYRKMSLCREIPHIVASDVGGDVAGGSACLAHGKSLTCDGDSAGSV